MELQYTAASPDLFRRFGAAFQVGGAPPPPLRPATPSASRSTAPAQPQRGTQIANLRLERFDALTHFLVGDPVSGLRDSACALSASTRSSISAAFGDARQQLGIARAEPRQLLASRAIRSTGMAGGSIFSSASGCVSCSNRLDELFLRSRGSTSAFPFKSPLHRRRSASELLDWRHLGFRSGACRRLLRSGRCSRLARAFRSVAATAAGSAHLQRARQQVAALRGSSASRTRYRDCALQSSGWRPRRARAGRP